MAIAGKRTLMQVADSNTGPFNTVQKINVGRVRVGSNNINVTKQTSWTEFNRRIQGLQECTWLMSGFWQQNDTEGQRKIWQAWKDDSQIAVRILPEGSTAHYWEQLAKVSQFVLRSRADGNVEVYIAVDGSEVPDVTPPECSWSLTRTFRDSEDIVASSTDIVGADDDPGCLWIELLFDIK